MLADFFQATAQCNICMNEVKDTECLLVLLLPFTGGCWSVGGPKKKWADGSNYETSDESSLQSKVREHKTKL